MIRILILFFLVAGTIVNAQIDTTNWYPLHIGDKWEYYGGGFGYSQVEVIGDTLMPNGNTYYIFSGGVYAWRYQRKVSNDTVYYYNTADRNEYMLFNFNLNDGELWKTPFESNWWGIFKTGLDNNNLINYPILYKIFERAIIENTTDPPDTTWGYLIDAYPTKITKGFGITSYIYDLETIVGIRINGVSYGTLVGVNENTEFVNEFQLYQNYPNPFNPSTTIQYQIPKSGLVTIKIYDVLGREVKTLYNQYQHSGEYLIKVYGNNLSSSVYYYQLKVGSFISTKKMLLLK